MVHTGHRDDPVKLTFSLEALIISIDGDLVPRPVSTVWQAILCPGVLESSLSLAKDSLLSWRANDRSHQTKKSLESPPPLIAAKRNVI